MKDFKEMFVWINIKTFYTNLVKVYSRPLVHHYMG